MGSQRMALEPVEPGQLWAGAETWAGAGTVRAVVAHVGGFGGLQLAIQPVDGTRDGARAVQEVAMKGIRPTAIDHPPGSLLLSVISWRIPIADRVHLRLPHGSDRVQLRRAPLADSICEAVWRP